MALRARLTPPRATTTDWAWHTAKYESVPATVFFGGARRMEAEGLLSSGYRIRQAIQSKSGGWTRFERVARTVLPPRLKAIQVDQEFGTPFLTASQVFHLRPIPRKWLALGRTTNSTERFVKPGTILVTRSGTVGRATLARDSLTNHLISDDLLRVEPLDAAYRGWIYAYLRSPTIIGLIQATHYGHIIKHLQPSHLNEIPIIEIDEAQRSKFEHNVQQMFDNRNRAEFLLKEAEQLLSSSLHLPTTVNSSSEYTIARCSELSEGRRRMEGAFYEAKVRCLLENVYSCSNRVDLLKDVAIRVWWMPRFSREYGANGVAYMSADDLFSISRISEKRVYTDPIENHEDFFVRKGWILMACSGQVYGLLGGVTLATRREEDYFLSHDLIRIAPRMGAIRAGYLFAYLGHPYLGRILVKRVAYGSSVPHIDPGDVLDVPVARLTNQRENEIADLAEEAAELHSEASRMEHSIGKEADDVVRDFVGTM